MEVNEAAVSDDWRRNNTRSQTERDTCLRMGAQIQIHSHDIRYTAFAALSITGRRGLPYSENMNIPQNHENGPDESNLFEILPH